jgi:hypothetical protein
VVPLQYLPKPQKNTNNKVHLKTGNPRYKYASAFNLVEVFWKLKERAMTLLFIQHSPSGQIKQLSILETGA